MLNRRTFLATLASLTPLASAAAQNTGRKPNVVILLADDLGYGELGFQGNAEIATPHIDSIAHNGVRCTNGYVSAPVCCPSRAGLMTGRYQTRFGHELNAIGKLNKQPGIGLPLSERTMADHMKAAGYVTGLFGKWHLGGTPAYHPMKRGFDEFFGFLHEGHFYFPEPYRGAVTRLRPSEPPYDEENPVLRGIEPVVEKQYLTDALAREATAFIDRHRTQPFFLYLAFNAIHSPMQAPVPLLKKVESIRDEHRRLFAAMLSSMDDAVGRVLAKLREHHLEEDTLILFLSDNGGPTGELTSSNEPLRGFKGQLFEGGIRIPFAVQWKGRLPAGKTYSEPVISLDILPTALAAAGGSAAPSLDGVNLLPYFTGEKRAAPHQSIFWRYGPSMALRRGKWKLLIQPEQRGAAARHRLFDLEKDASETRDVAAVNENLVRELKSEMDRINTEMKPPLWGKV